MSARCDTRHATVGWRQIAEGLAPPAGWVEVAPNRASYKYKIRNESGFATIAVREPQEVLFGIVPSSEVQQASDVLKLYSIDTIRTRFVAQESRDARGVPSLHRVERGSLGGVDALIFDCDYTIVDTGRVIAIIYYVVLGEGGWILVNLSFMRNDEAARRPQLEAILAQLSLTP